MKMVLLIDFEEDQSICLDEDFFNGLVELIHKNKLNDVFKIHVMGEGREDFDFPIPVRH